MSCIQIEDIAHVRFSAPDLGEMARFLTAFGLSSRIEPDGRLYAHTADGSPFVHVTEPGEPAFLGLGLRATCEADLERLAASEGVEIRPIDGPGGGRMAILQDPDGFRIEVVAGQSRVAAHATAPEPDHNTAMARRRFGAFVRTGNGPSTAIRLGHAVLEVRDFRASEAWYKSRFGLLTSDEIEAGPGAAIGAFLRCDRGATPTDHHTLFLLQAPSAPRFNHAAFEVAHLDDLMRGRDHLLADGRTPAWGVGRHFLGSQIFDYWKDPWGHELEHWTDGDLLTADVPPAISSFETLLGVQWGDRHPMMRAARQGQAQ